MVHCYILCWNEEKMIRHTLNHYSMFCSQITVLDNHSTDATCEIIRKEFPQVIIQKFDTGGQVRDDIYLDLKNNCWKASRGKADWVVVCDADEFLFHHDIKKELQIRKENKETLPVIQGFNMVHHEFPTDYKRPLYEQVQTGIRAFNFDKQILFDPNETIEINYQPGAHDCRPTIKTAHVVDPHPLNLLHFKYMGREHLYERHRLYASRISRFNQKNGFGAEYTFGKKHVDECFDLFEKDPQFKPYNIIDPEKETLEQTMQKIYGPPVDIKQIEEHRRIQKMNEEKAKNEGGE